MVDAHWKVGCPGCDWQGTIAAALSAQNPFDPNETIHGCPECKEPNGLRVVCDAPGCAEWQTCGTPTPSGYRLVCGKHYRQIEAVKAAVSDAALKEDNAQ